MWHAQFLILFFNFLVFLSSGEDALISERVTLSAFVSHQLLLPSDHYLRLAVKVASFRGILGFLTGCLGVSTGFGPSSM